ncbi:methyltransferase domain-containing protein [Salinibius halmophilus]|uniref:methyltransferase domain-containing protein n=1 Tax=Salinibius halmophilus TaxID=1853216 RepID=UPI0013144A52|nr:methyltransferase domain-containing protein [Salinibius halmophilus]
MQDDVFFDQLADRFSDKIYGSTKGRLRLAVQQDAISQLPSFSSQAWRVLEIGGGLGHLSEWLAQNGHQVLMTEPSEKMVAAAKQRLQLTSVDVQQASYQSLSVEQHGQFEMVTVCAVLEWLADPQAALKRAYELTAPGGYLVVMAYNRDAQRMTRFLNGTGVQSLLDRPGNGRCMMPTTLFSASDLRGWLEALGGNVIDWRGIRCINDWIPDLPFEEILQIETAINQEEPWRSLARYQHIIVRK